MYRVQFFGRARLALAGVGATCGSSSEAKIRRSYNSVTSGAAFQAAIGLRGSDFNTV